MMNYKLIRCLTPTQRGLDVIEKLNKMGVFSANRSFSRGISVTKNKNSETQVIEVIVEESRAEDIFEFLYYEFEMDKPSNGIIFQSAIIKSSNYKVK